MVKLYIVQPYKNRTLCGLKQPDNVDGTDIQWHVLELYANTKH